MASTLPSGSTSATHLVDAELAGDGLGGAAVVAGDHRHLQAHGMQRRDCRGRRRLDRIGDGDDGGEPAIDGGIERRLAFVAQRSAATSAKPRDVEAELFHVARRADRDLAARDDRREHRSRARPRSPSALGNGMALAPAPP